MNLLGALWFSGSSHRAGGQAYLLVLLGSQGHTLYIGEMTFQRRAAAAGPGGEDACAPTWALTTERAASSRGGWGPVS